MAAFRKKPVVIEAVQLRWDNWAEMCDFAGVGSLTDGKPQEGYTRDGGQTFADSDYIGTDAEMALAIPTLEGLMVARLNDWVIRGVAGELYPCKPDIFEATYEAVEPAEVA